MMSLVHNAREGRIEKLDPALAGAFVEENHRQGMAVPGKRLKCYGLFIEDELLAVAMFCNPRTSAMQRKYTTELFRLAFKKGHRIRGGASKLIKHFLKVEKPWDLFTYQDTAGEAGAVYEHSGMKLVGKVNPTKKVLVKNGLNWSQAKNNHSDWFSLELANKRGPDALLNTQLGEVFELVDGKKKRVSNIRLFTEKLDYHLEEIPGDRVYEWKNPNVSYYVYKVTSTKDDGYYIGRRTIRVADAKLEDCLNDPYFGSGGKRLQSWVSSVGEDSLRKEILGIYPSWEKVLRAEAKALGDLHVSDPLCKNTFPGGFWSGFVIAGGTVSEKSCEIHGLSKHYGKTCMKCMSQKNISVLTCLTHGETKHIGNSCAKCTSDSFRKLELCPTHGRTKFVGAHCLKCMQGKINQMGTCEVHGETLFKGSTCIKCSRGNSMALKKCSVHGESKHQGNSCIKCSRAKATKELMCSVHGLSKHQGETCIKCSRAKAVSVKNCGIHGESKHQGSTCIKCSRDKNKR